MQYHISTGLITKHFEKQCDCPLCEIEKIVENNIAREFLADACMDNDVRLLVNKYGFCDKHYDLLYSMQSKLSLALQIDTRMNTLINVMGKPTNYKQAKKVAKQLESELSTCIICDYIEKEMVKYYKTMAQMFENESEFKSMLENSNGFCLKHYGKLLQYSNYAFFKCKQYLQCLTTLQNERFNQTKQLVKQFSNHHDYRVIKTSMGEASSALNVARSRLYGKKD